MKKTLLICLTAAISASAVAVEPVVMNDAVVGSVSADGKYVVSALMGTMILRNVATGQQTVFEPIEGTTYYDMGLGTCVSNTGVIVGSTTDQYNASYYENGEWHSLDTPYPANLNLPHSITPDAKRICGNVGMSAIDLDSKVIMQVPVYWDRNDDGTYSAYHLLPHPETDLCGAVPQYVTAMGISHDGKTIIGQVVDNAGMIIQPIVYREDAEGKWSYELVHNELFNPDHIVLPEDPGDYPQQPDVKEYMTPEKLAEYEAAYQKWIDSFYQQDLYPNPADYLTPEAIEAYNAAVEVYNKEAEAYNEKMDARLEAYDKVRTSSPSFVYNSTCISPDGQYVAAAATIEDENGEVGFWGPATINQPWRFNFFNNTIDKYESDLDLIPTCIIEGGVMLASTPAQTEKTTACILDVPTNEFITLHKYFESLAPEYAQWMTENLTFDIETYDFENDEFKTDKYFITGTPVASAKLETIATWIANVWDYSTIAQSYIFDMTSYLGVSDVTADAVEAKNVKAYNLQGIEVDRNTKGLIILSNGTKVFNR